MYREILLGFEELRDAHTGLYLSKILLDVLDQCEIPLDRIIALTSDNASNNNTLSRKLDDVIQGLRSATESSHKIARLPCLAHVIQLACKEILTGTKVNPKNDAQITIWNEEESERARHTAATVTDGLPWSIKKLRDIVIYINASPQRRAKFHQLQSRNRPLNLLQDVATRWNSTLRMLLRARQLQKDITRYAEEYPHEGILILTDIEWKHVDYMIEILYPFYRLTNAVGTILNGPSIFLVFVTYTKLLDHLLLYCNKLSRKEEPWKKMLYEALANAHEKLMKYYNKTQQSEGDTYAIGSALVPHWKLSAFQGEEYSAARLSTRTTWVCMGDYIDDYKTSDFPTASILHAAYAYGVRPVY